MSEFVIEHTCGHTVTHSSAASPAAQAKREQWLRQHLCQKCHHTQQAKAAQDRSVEMDLPELTGEEDEIAWATVIRDKAIAHNQEIHDKLVRPRKTDPDPETTQAVHQAANKAMDELINQHEAAWWIGKRFDLTAYVRTAAIEAVTQSITEHTEAE